PATSRTSPRAIVAEQGIDPLGDGAVVATAAVDELDVGELAKPGQLAAGVSAVLALDRVDIAAQELVEAERRPGGPRGAGRLRTAGVAGGSGGHHRIDPGV